MKTLNEVQKYLSRIKSINSGGCGVAALAMYRWLKKNSQLAKDTELVYLHKSYDRSAYINNRKILNKLSLSKEVNLKPESCSHALIYHKGNYLDSNGVNNDYPYKYKSHILNENFIVDSLNDIFQWNHSFDRKQIPKIAKKLDIDLSDINLN